MRFMILVKSNEDSEAGMLPPEKDIVAMGKFNASLAKSGALLAAEGLQASSKGARMKFGSSGRPIVTDGPFAETKELIAGFWMVQAQSLDQVIEWFRDCPAEVGAIEIRQVFEAADFEPMINSDEGREAMDAEEEFRRHAAK